MLRVTLIGIEYSQNKRENKWGGGEQEPCGVIEQQNSGKSQRKSSNPRFGPSEC